MRPNRKVLASSAGSVVGALGALLVLFAVDQSGSQISNTVYQIVMLVSGYVGSFASGYVTKEWAD